MNCPELRAFIYFFHVNTYSRRRRSFSLQNVRNNEALWSRPVREKHDFFGHSRIILDSYACADPLSSIKSPITLQCKPLFQNACVMWRASYINYSLGPFQVVLFNKFSVGLAVLLKLNMTLTHQLSPARQARHCSRHVAPVVILSLSRLAAPPPRDQGRSSLFLYPSHCDCRRRRRRWEDRTLCAR